ncbi:hypothetical protein SK128_019050 [Halocaridina rubra]|uniref:Phospholipid scramblase n=1 Tax=Halocaridina rubra TaxID=373956 RepID=A0AAN9AFA1_HALRR
MADNNTGIEVKNGHSSSERDALLGPRRSPPPRYSSMDGDELQTHGNASSPAPPIAPVHPVANGSSMYAPVITQIPPPQPHNPNAYGYSYQSGVYPGGWCSYIPGQHQPFPPGIEHLANLHEITVTNRGSKYRIWHHDSHQLFTAKMLNPRYCGVGSKGDAELKVFNNANLEVLNLCRTVESSGCCCSFDETHVEVSFNPGNIIGVVQGSKMEYSILNPSGDTLYLLEGQGFGCCSKGGFNILSCHHDIIGFITMETPSCCGKSNVLRLEFPAQMDIRSKALLMSAGIAIRDLHWK